MPASRFHRDKFSRPRQPPACSRPANPVSDFPTVGFCDGQKRKTHGHDTSDRFRPHRVVFEGLPPIQVPGWGSAGPALRSCGSCCGAVERPQGRRAGLALRGRGIRPRTRPRRKAAMSRRVQTPPGHAIACPSSGGVKPPLRYAAGPLPPLWHGQLGHDSTRAGCP